jgi:hypothetical protein
MVIKSYSLWDTMPYSTLKVYRRFIGTCRIALLATSIHSGFLLSLLFEPEISGDMILLKRRSTINVLYSVISKMAELFT